MMSDLKDTIVTTHPSVASSDHRRPSEASRNPHDVGSQDANPQQADSSSEAAPADQLDNKKKGFLAYFKTKEFYIILILG
jgi:solute carrier family 35 protein F1/2